MTHLADLRRFLATPYEVPHLVGEGVLIEASPRYYAGAYVTIKMLRHVGCELPVQLWTDEVPPAALRALAEYRIRPAGRAWTNCTPRTYAILNCGFRRVFVCDADAYPVKSVVDMFARTAEHGAVVWWDVIDGDAFGFNTEGYGLTTPCRHTLYNVQGGAYCLDLERCYAVARLAHYFNERGDIYNHFGCMDQTHLRVAFEYAGVTPFSYTDQRVAKHPSHRVFLNSDGKGTLLVHRTGDKWGEGRRFPDLPLEDVAWGYYAEFTRSG